VKFAIEGRKKKRKGMRERTKLDSLVLLDSANSETVEQQMG
jgi:hypothetical protein